MKKLLLVSSVTALAAGILLIAGGAGGVWYTYQKVAGENIVTTPDSAIPEKPVRGPFTLKAQADIMRTHVLKMTGGKTYSEMPRQVPKLDENGQAVLDKDGKPVMAPNTARDIWVTYTALTTALNLGILTYAFSGLSLLLGLLSLLGSGVLFRLSKKMG